jgi:hypothetical protein
MPWINCRRTSFTIIKIIADSAIEAKLTIPKISIATITMPVTRLFDIINIHFYLEKKSEKFVHEEFIQRNRKKINSMPIPL